MDFFLKKKLKNKMNEIKKILYKEKPIAKFKMIRMEFAYYVTETSLGEVKFVIPVSDMGEADFLPEMDAKLLIRWIEV